MKMRERRKYDELKAQPDVAARLAWNAKAFHAAINRGKIFPPVPEKYRKA
jgi:hypothetical protein